jgi:hypothetical protein
MRTMIPRTEHHKPALLRRLTIVLALTTTLRLGAVSRAALAAPHAAPARPATQGAVTPPAAQPVPGPRPAATVLPLVLGAIVILAAYNNPPRYHYGSH